MWTVRRCWASIPCRRTQRTPWAVLELDAEVVAALQLQPTRIADRAAASDPTIYRFHEALDVYGTAIKELIHEEFGDGIKSAINSNLSIARRPAPDGDRVVVTALLRWPRAGSGRLG